MLNFEATTLRIRYVPDEKPNELLTRNKHICTQITYTHTDIYTNLHTH